MKKIFYGKQSIDSEDIKSVVNVMNSDFLTQGPISPKFEKSLSEYCDSKFCTVVNSATSALHLGCLALGVGKKDIVWTSSISFVASSNCALYCGASVDFVDIDPLTSNLSISKLEEKLEHSKKIGKLPKVVIPVHLQGQSCEMDKIKKLSNKYKFKILEDASHALGGSYKDKKVGSCSFSDACVFSFHPVKNITSGEGGALLTNNRIIDKKLKLLRSHGITRDVNKAKKMPWYYEQVDLGFNYRMTDIQAALGLSQLSKIDEFRKRKAKIADYYDKALSNLGLGLPSREKHIISGLHLYVIKVKSNLMRNKIYRELEKHGYICNMHYIPIPAQPFYKKMGFRINDFPCAKEYYSSALTIPMYPSLSMEHPKTISSIIKKCLL